MKLIYIENDKYLNLNDGKFYGDEELDFIMEMEIGHEKEFKFSPSIYTLMEMFPTAKQAAKRGVIRKIKLWEQEIDKIIKYRENYINNLQTSTDILLPDETKLYIDSFTERKISEIKDEIEKLKKEKKYINILIDKEKGKNIDKKDRITQQTIEEAKQRQITDFINTRKDNKAMCIFHDDKHPSMHIYKETNTFHCFSCGAHGTVIDIIMRLRSVDFIEAVKYLKNI